jgi:cyclopropane-fatty-acyl-phospholipid synthase
MHAAATYGCRVTTTTISEKQHTLATERVRAARLDDRVTVVLRDYRDLEGRFDKLVSIEMIEAVGHANLGTYFEAIARLLKPGGLCALQAITMPGDRYEQYRRTPDFIQQYVFPGSCCPSLQAMTAAMARTPLSVLQLEDITPHYAETLRRWRRRFFDRIEEVRALGCDDTFIRLWDYYLSYCEAGFAESYIRTVQMVIGAPGAVSQPTRLETHGAEARYRPWSTWSC